MSSLEVTVEDVGPAVRVTVGSASATVAPDVLLTQLMNYSPNFVSAMSDVTRRILIAALNSE